MEKRTCIYYLENCGDFSALEAEVKQIKGVISANIDRSACFLRYEIDEWASDYDVFAAVLSLAEAAGCVIDFEKTDKKAAETDNDAEKLESSDKAAEGEVGANSDHAENAKNDKNAKNGENSANAKNGEKRADKDGDGSDNDNGDAEEDEGDKKRSKPRKAISEPVQNLIVFSAGLVALLVGYLVKNDTAKTVMLALAFALSGYELLYDITCDILKKRILTPELISLLGVVAALFLGYAEQAVTAMLLLVALKNCVLALKKFVLKDTPASDIDEKVSVLVKKNGNEREIEALVCDVKSGDVLNYRKGEKCRFDCVLNSDFATISRVIGDETVELELKRGDKVFKGDELLSVARVRVEKGFSGELNGTERMFVARVRENSVLCEKFEKKRVIICAVVAFVCLVIAFVLPIFSEDYVTGLYRWGYFAAIIAVVLGGGRILDVVSLACVASLACGYKNDIMAFGQSGYCVAEECKLVALDKENALDLPNGEIKGDCEGAVRELKDCGKKLALLTLLSGEEAAELCKKLKIHEYYCFNTEQEKAEKIKELLANGVLCVTDAKNACGLSVALGASLEGESLEGEGLANENLAAGESGNKKENEKVSENCADGDKFSSCALIFSDEIAFAPYVIKLAKRAAKAKKLTVVFGFIVKLALIALGAFGLASVWWAVLADVCVGAACSLFAALLGKEVY